MVSEGTARGYDAMFVHHQATTVAMEVAEANQAVDENTSDSSLWGHTLHWYSHAQARAVGEDAIAAADPSLFGRASHAIQDYYTHFGSGFTGYGGRRGVADYDSRLALEDEHTLAGADLGSLPSNKPSTVLGRTIVDLGLPRSSWKGHAVIYSDEYNAFDALDNVMRREYEVYARQFASKWWDRLPPVRSEDKRRIMQ